MNKKIIIISIIAVFILTIINIIIFLPPTFKFKSKDLTIEYGTKYQETPYKVERFGKDYTKKVTVKNNINYQKLGTYHLTYQVKIGLITFKEIRNLKLVDNTKPELILTGSPEVLVCPNQKYTEEGYKATDNYDGDITSKVKVKERENTLFYTVKDSSNNKTTMTRKITYEDKTAPIITLSNPNKETIYVGGAYHKSDYTATDNCDGDITSKVVVTENVDPNKTGTYNITYHVTDNANNSTEVVKVIKVIARPTYDSNSLGVIYLTFDDGPKEGTTNTILDILKEEGIKATFFVTNSGPDYLIKREYDEGHTVALHTASHNYATLYQSVEAYFNDLSTVQNRVERITGYKSMIIRFPGGSSNTISRRYCQNIMSTLTSEVLNRGYHYFDWNISSGDAGSVKTASGVYNNVVNNLSKTRTNMVLMHDIKSYTKDALRDIIRYGKENGYRFERITMDTKMITQRVNN